MSYSTGHYLSAGLPAPSASDASATATRAGVARSSDIAMYFSENILPTFEPCVPLSIKYGDNAVPLGGNLTQEITKQLPSVSFEGSPGRKYTLLMIDPDVPGPQNVQLRNFLHWAIVDIPSSGTIKDGREIVSYAPCTPPLGIHRYTFVLLEQPIGDGVRKFDSEVSTRLTGLMNRTRFDAMAFIAATGGRPVGITFFREEAPGSVLGKAGNFASAAGGMVGLA